MSTVIKDQNIIDLFSQYDGYLLEVKTKRGKIHKVLNIAWGYDEGDEYAHITSNISPEIKDTSIDVFFTNEIINIFSVAKNESIYNTNGA